MSAAMNGRPMALMPEVKVRGIHNCLAQPWYLPFGLEGSCDTYGNVCIHDELTTCLIWRALQSYLNQAGIELIMEFEQSCKASRRVLVKGCVCFMQVEGASKYM